MIEWLRQKKINYLYKKACKAMAKFDNAIGKDNKNLFMKQLLNRVYGKKYMDALFKQEQNKQTQEYIDNDIAICKKFIKNREV